MAEVFLATSFGPSGFKKRLVIKRLLPHLEATARFTKMFLEEARVAALLDHPHLAQVWGCGEIDGRHYLAMEYIDGATLAELLRAHRAFEPRVAVAVAIDLLDALHAVHTATDHHTGLSLGLVHRDVTPRNVMITRAGVVKLLDFGIAVPIGEAAASAMGTVKYMSPEQLLNAPLDARSDLYSVALLLLSLVCRRPPFEGAERGVVARPAEVPEVLWTVVSRALAIEVVDRFTTARQMQVALQEVLETWALRDRARPGRAQLADLVAIARPTFARQALTRVTRLTRLTRSVAAADQTAPVVKTARVEPRERSGVVRWGWIVGALLSAGAASAVLVERTGTQTAAEKMPPAATPAPAPVEKSAPALMPEKEEMPVLAEPRPEVSALPAETPMPPAKRRRAKAPKRAAGAGPGYLSVDARPWAEVYVDGRRVGTTPLERIEVRSGLRRVALKNDRFAIDSDFEVLIRPDEVSAIRKTFPVEVDTPSSRLHSPRPE